MICSIRLLAAAGLHRRLTARRGLCLPSGPWVTPEDVRMIVGEIAYLISSQSASMT